MLMKDAGFRHFGAEHEVRATESQALLEIRIVPAWAPGAPSPPPDLGRGGTTTGGAYAPDAERHELPDPVGRAGAAAGNHDGPGRHPLVRRNRRRQDRSHDRRGCADPIPALANPTAGSPPGPTAITTGPDGALWFVGIPGEIGRITTSGVVTEFSLPAVPPATGSPSGTPDSPATPAAITVGPDGALWFTGIPGEIGRMTTSGVVTEFPITATAQAIAVGSDGALWFTGISGEIGRITTSGVVTEYPLPEVQGDPMDLGAITSGPDGALWCTGVAGELTRITTTGVVTEFTVPALPPPSPRTPIGSPVPGTIIAGPDGNLWFTGQTV
jgi:streptogramin lyase